MAFSKLNYSRSPKLDSKVVQMINSNDIHPRPSLKPAKQLDEARETSRGSRIIKTSDLRKVIITAEIIGQPISKRGRHRYV